MELTAKGTTSRFRNVFLSRQSMSSISSNPNGSTDVYLLDSAVQLLSVVKL
jgi:hypothetical protein